MAKNIRICRYVFCKHDTKEIDITKEEFQKDGNSYYHLDCFKSKSEGSDKSEQEKADLQLIKDLWSKHINRTVVYSQLMRELNNLLARGIESEYLVFVMQYVISHKMNLNYPGGFKYFVDKAEIKNAYKSKKNKEIKRIDIQSFKAKENKDDLPKFNPNSIKKTVGFGDILKRG